MLLHGVGLDNVGQLFKVLDVLRHAVVVAARHDQVHARPQLRAVGQQALKHCHGLSQEGRNKEIRK